MSLSFTRRNALALAGAAVLAPALPAFAQGGGLLARAIPSSGERLPSVGVGTAIIFDFENDPAKFSERAEVLKTLVNAITAGHDQANAQAKNVADHVKAAAAMVAATKPPAGGAK